MEHGKKASMRDKTCCFTGHRKLPPSKRNQIALQLEKTVIRLIDRGIIFYGAGGALGFDTLAAQTVLSLREDYPQIKLILVLPCLTQTRGWSEADITVYENIKRQADKVVYTSQTYFQGCMHKRNRHLVDNSSVCLCYLTESKSGTYRTVQYAQKCGCQIINLAKHKENEHEKSIGLYSGTSGRNADIK